MLKKILTSIISIVTILSLVMCFLSACSKEEEPKVKYKKDSLKDITFEYPDTYEPDYRDEDQTSYLLNKNEGIIFILYWDENRKEDISDKGELHEVGDIKGYYWKDEDGFNYGFVIRDKEDKLIEYRVFVEDEETFWKVVDSVKLLK